METQLVLQHYAWRFFLLWICPLFVGLQIEIAYHSWCKVLYSGHMQVFLFFNILFVNLLSHSQTKREATVLYSIPLFVLQILLEISAKLPGLPPASHWSLPLAYFQIGRVVSLFIPTNKERWRSTPNYIPDTNAAIWWGTSLSRAGAFGACRAAVLNVRPAGPIPNHEQAFSGQGDFLCTKSKFVSAHISFSSVWETWLTFTSSPHLVIQPLLIFVSRFFFCLLSDHESLQLAPPDLLPSYYVLPTLTSTSLSLLYSVTGREKIELALASLGTTIIGKQLTGRCTFIGPLPLRPVSFFLLHLVKHSLLLYFAVLFS